MPDSEIITRCPQCNTAFRVTANQLAVADGVVRCGSCLAVFKAIDYKSRSGETVTPIDSAKKTKKTGNSKKTKAKTTEVAEANNTPTVPKESEELINDSADEMGLSLEEDIYDLDTNNKNKKTSLFERKLQPITQHTRERADESWALDMLADLEDGEEIKPLNIKRKPKELDTPPKKTEPQAKQPDPPKKILSDPEPMVATPSPAKTESKPASIKEDKEVLFFDHDTVDHTHEQQRNTQDLKSSIEVEVEHGFSQISDEEIENAMHTRTGYADDNKHFLDNIEPAPVEMEWYESHNTQRWLWTGGAVLTGLILIIQIAAYRFDTLSLSPTYRPFYQTTCNIFGCQLPDLIDTDKVRTTNLIVRSHPNEQNALIIDAILTNIAKFEQPFPGLRLEFSDINNSLVAARNLQPKDYLRGELAGVTKMAVNQPIQISLGIVDPGKHAVNYQLSVIKADSDN